MRRARNLIRRTLKRDCYDPDAVAWPSFRMWVRSWAALLRRDPAAAHGIWTAWEIEMEWVG